MREICFPVARPSSRSTTVFPRSRTSVGTVDTSSARASSSFASVSTWTTRSRFFSVTPNHATRLAMRRAGPERRFEKKRSTGRSSRLA
jgi:hypothetical protein